MAAVLAFSINTGHLALDPERRPAIMKVHAADRLVERAVAVVVLAHLEFALKYIRAHARDPRAKHVQTMPELMKLLKDIWFTPYRRWRPNDSSGFEHVFVGEESRAVWKSNQCVGCTREF